MTFQFSQEHEMVRQMLRRWTTERLEPKVDDIEDGEPPYELMRDLSRTFGLSAMADSTFARLEKKAQAADAGDGDSKDDSKDLGASGGVDPALNAILSMELARVCPGFMLAFGASMGLAGGAIMRRGTLAQKQRWGRPLLCFDRIGAWGMTEPGAGSDAFRAMRTVAVPDGDGYVLNGQKTFITNAPYADILVVYAKIDRRDGTASADRAIEAFVVERDDPGVSVSAPMRKMGMHASPTGEIFLEDCRVPADRLLGMTERASGRAGGRDVFHAERTGMAPMCAGIIQRCLELCVDYAKDRTTWGKSIAEYQLVQDKLARMFMHFQNVEALMFKQIALTRERRSMSPAEASATKLYCARATTECTLEAIQLLGGNGYMREYRVEMLMRDAKLLQIGGGTDEIQIINIARHLLR
ncbi:acyl-CoA dehydrogenase family protein [Haliangium sp.]|uniref:acyl-CoA dehydrogenase family protein n=1 Tax=Haliangium sp. TaxID=2663208 RepID=UPI003D1103B0